MALYHSLIVTPCFPYDQAVTDGSGIQGIEGMIDDVIDYMVNQRDEMFMTLFRNLLIDHPVTESKDQFVRVLDVVVELEDPEDQEYILDKIFEVLETVVEVNPWLYREDYETIVRELIRLDLQNNCQNVIQYIEQRIPEYWSYFYPYISNGNDLELEKHEVKPLVRLIVDDFVKTIQKIDETDRALLDMLTIDELPYPDPGLPNVSNHANRLSEFLNSLNFKDVDHIFDDDFPIDKRILQPDVDHVFSVLKPVAKAAVIGSVSALRIYCRHGVTERKMSKYLQYVTKRYRNHEATQYLERIQGTVRTRAESEYCDTVGPGRNPRGFLTYGTLF